MASKPPRRDATTRFSDRVEDYVRFRPAYPPAVIACLTGVYGLRPAHSVADVGSGTGILAEMLLRNGNAVFGVEPNPEMRAAAECVLAPYPHFHSVDGRAEATTLRDASVDWVMAGQAFHWFHPDAARREFARILRPTASTRDGQGSGSTTDSTASRSAGRVVLLWNNRRDDTPFLRDYEAFLREYSDDYAAVRHEQVETDGRLERFFAGGHVRYTFANRQVLDFAGLRGRTQSASYMPGPHDARHPAMLRALEEIFARHAQSGQVALEYDTRVYVGCLADRDAGAEAASTSRG